jgi:uncharacterized protein
MGMSHIKAFLFLALLVTSFACKPSASEVTSEHSGPVSMPVELEAAPPVAEPSIPTAPTPVEAPPVDETPEALGDIEKSLLWRVDGPNGPLWLFGTIHAGVDFSDWNNVPMHIRLAMRSSQRMVVEIDLKEVTNELLAERVMLPADQKLSTMLSKNRWDTLVEATDIPAQNLERFQPWFAFILLTQSLYEDVEAMDQSIYKFARNRYKKLEFLETPMEQIDSIVEIADLELLGETLDNLEQVAVDAQKILAIYKAGDLDALESAIFDEQSAHYSPRFIEAMFNRRNRAWIPKIEAHLDHGHVFVAVGAGHLVGPEGLLTLLEARGHKAHRVVR